MYFIIKNKYSSKDFVLCYILDTKTNVTKKYCLNGKIGK